MFFRAAVLFSKVGIKKPNVVYKIPSVLYKKPNLSYNLLHSPFSLTLNNTLNKTLYRSFASKSQQPSQPIQQQLKPAIFPITHRSETIVSNLFYQIRSNRWEMLILNNLSALDLSLNLSGIRHQTTQSMYYDKFMNLQRCTYDMQCRNIPLGRKLTMSSDFRWDFERHKRAKITFASCNSLVLPTIKINHDIDFPLAIIPQMNIFKPHEYTDIIYYVETRKKQLKC